jgi:large subunit ribosomal protein L15
MTLRLDSLKPNKGARRRKLRKGRGIAAGQGASCGFGMRGQKSRSGRPTRPGFEGGQMPLYRRVPKLKHFPLVNPKFFTVLNVSALNELKAGSTVNLDSLVKDGVVTSPKHPLKVLGNGELKVKLTVQAAAFTASARSKIEAAGGSCEVPDQALSCCWAGLFFRGRLGPTAGLSDEPACYVVFGRLRATINGELRTGKRRGSRSF